jgi:hypothetical protein|nr:hypothetical protein [Candidatus Krumholzibacteria bacterium]
MYTKLETKTKDCPVPGEKTPSQETCVCTCKRSADKEEKPAPAADYTMVNMGIDLEVNG